MSESVDKTSVARQIELIIRQLNTLSTLPQVAAGILPCVLKEPFQTGELTQIIEADSAMTASVLALAARLGILGAEGSKPLAEVIDELPSAALRDAVLSVKVVQAVDCPTDADSTRPLPRRQMALHALATACCASLIAQLTLDETDRKLAFTAGLLHDIGKTALDEVMPKSFDQLVLQAAQKKQSLSTIEQDHLGLTHALLGKRLAEKWRLPEPIIQAIWLHHADPRILLEMPHGRLVMVTLLADELARKSGIGQSGSYDTPEQDTLLARLLGLNAQQISQIMAQLPEQVEQKSKPLGLSNLDRAQDYYEMIHLAAAQLARDNSSMAQQSRRSFDATLFADPVQQFLNTLSTGSSPDQVAAQFAQCLQQTLHTGSVLILLWPEQHTEPAEMAIATADGTSEAALLAIPDTVDLKTNPFGEGFKIIRADEAFGWCIEQIRWLAPSRTLAAPLLLSGKPVAVALFESDTNLPAETLQMLCSIGASTISASKAFRAQREQTERLVDLMDKLRTADRDLTEARSLAAVAEMAAGAAHELNNPLAVISGRAQLLMQSENDTAKKQILEQIFQRTQDISDIITDLMSFARPRAPYKHLVAPAVLVSEAIEKTARLHNLPQLTVTLKDIEPLPDVFVDKTQVIQAISHILSNAVESYLGQDSGPITIEGHLLNENTLVEIRIIDSGCGMNEATLRQATRPFFSAKPAGRKRGMGLAHAQRLLSLNNASLRLDSIPGKGTTVTIRLPRV
ncbi:HDOD domain-containing protein [Anaerohalosphaeraceae bacterium U12dextr]